MKKSLLLLPLTMAFLCGCKESSSIQTYQPPINVETSVVNEESAVKKTTKASSKTSTKSNKTTTTTVPKTNTSTIKDLIIDGNGNLVATKSNNTFAIIGNVRGEKGAKGDTGERGAQGEKGQDGRGIASCNVNSDGDLIITYTDGTTQNAGNVRQEVIVHDYEQAGYILKNSITSPQSGHAHCSGSDFDYTINYAKVELLDVNDNNPTLKYHYKYSFSIDVSNYSSHAQQADFTQQENYGVEVDNSTYFGDSYVTYAYKNGSYTDGTVSFTQKEIYSSVPLLEITNAPFVYKSPI